MIVNYMTGATATSELKIADKSADIISLYSLRLGRRGYTGPLISIRRVVDNATFDIYPDANGDLDEATIEAFLFGGDGTVRAIFDQMPGGRDVVQATNAEQPYIAIGGSVLKTTNDKPAIRFTGDQNLYANAAGSIPSGSNPKTISLVAEGLETGEGGDCGVLDGSIGGSNFAIGLSTNEIRSRYINQNRGVDGLSLSGPHAYTLAWGGIQPSSTDRHFLDAALQTDVNLVGEDVTINTANVPIKIGKRAFEANFLFNEFITYNRDIGNASIIIDQQNQIDYWGISI